MQKNGITTFDDECTCDLYHFEIKYGFGLQFIILLPQITYNNKRALFIYLIVTLVLFTFVLVMDCIDIYIWYIKGDHAVVRSIGTLNKLISLGFLEPSTQQTQVIQQNHIRPETIDEFGYKIT
eukprot:481007_1